MAMVDNNTPQPPERPLLEVLAERSYFDRRVKEIAEEVEAEEAAKKNTAFAQQERFNNAWSKWLQRWSDQLHGH